MWLKPNGSMMPMQLGALAVVAAFLYFTVTSRQLHQPNLEVRDLKVAVLDLQQQVQQIRERETHMTDLLKHRDSVRSELAAHGPDLTTISSLRPVLTVRPTLTQKVNTLLSTAPPIISAVVATVKPAALSTPSTASRLLENANQATGRDASNLTKISPTSISTTCEDTAAPATTLVTFIVQNPRTGSLYMSGRLQKYGSGKFTYDWIRAKAMKPRPFGPSATPGDWLHHACGEIPGYKVVVYDSGASPNWWLSNWPANTVLIMTGDEMGRWGLYSKARYWGPFGTDRESFFEENTTSPHRHILLPPTIRPWFRQYYDSKQREAFGTSALFVPLGSRVEFPDITPDQITLAADRKYIYVLMMALTDNSRAELRDALKAATDIPEDRTFVHIAAQWHPELTNEEYVSPAEYAKYMLNSIFTPCPKGRSLDTFRLYEAMEAGSIPIIELRDGYANEHLPPAFFDSPILFVETWADAPAAMLSLMKDPIALNARQKAVMAWYVQMMHGVVGQLETLLLSRRKICYTSARDSDCTSL